jgi:hypothetical protein
MDSPTILICRPSIHIACFLEGVGEEEGRGVDFILCVCVCMYRRKDPEKGKEAAGPSNIKEIQEIQGGQEAPHNGGAISPKDA